MKLPAPFAGMRALKTLVLDAQAEASRLGDASTGAEHLLIAAFNQPDGAARSAFARAGADPDAFVDAVESAHEAALRGLGLRPVDPALLGAGTRGPQRLGESAAHVLRSAAAMSKSARAELLGAQIVAAVATLEHGTAARALREQGVDRAELAVAADAELRAIRDAA